LRQDLEGLTETIEELRERVSRERKQRKKIEGEMAGLEKKITKEMKFIKKNIVDELDGGKQASWSGRGSDRVRTRHLFSDEDDNHAKIQVII
jgi:hypothetical protein